MNPYKNLPSDTPDHIIDMQISIVQKKSLMERLKMCSDMAEFSIYMLKNQITERHPGISDGQLKFEVVKSLYADCYSEEALNRIKAHFYDLPNQNREI
jgi:hypothetical protein